MSKTTSEGRSNDTLIPTRASLIARLKNWDDSESWQQFFEIYWQFIHRRACKHGLSDQEAQEVVQETVIAVARQMDKSGYDPARSKFSTWLYRIVSRRIADQYRKRRRGTAAMEPLPENEDNLPVERVADPTSRQPDEEWEREWEANLINAAMVRVKEQVKLRHLQIFQYHTLQRHSVAETARHLQTNAATVYLIKHRVGRLLKKELERLRKEPL